MDRLYWVIDRELAGRAGPAKEPWNVWQLASIGIGGIVSLDDAGDVRQLRMAGIKHLAAYQPMVLLEDEQQRVAFAVQLPPIHQFIDDCRKLGQAVLVHCFHGCDRTGAVLASYLVGRCGLSADDAVSHVRRVNPQAMSALGYEEVVHTFAKIQAKGLEATIAELTDGFGEGWFSGNFWGAG